MVRVGRLGACLAAGFLGLAFMLVAVPAPAQGTRSDYERAANLRGLFDGKVVRDSVRPQWLPGNTRFWYRVTTGPAAHEFVLVDAEKGTRQPAFDHARMAAALARAGVRDTEAGRLPIERLEFLPAEESLDLRCGGKWWRCNLRTYDLREQPRQETPPAAKPLAKVPRASTRTGAETSVTFANRTGAEVELFWLDPDGQRQSYGTITAHQERDQHTFEGHVWLVVDPKGEVLAAFEATAEPSTVEITDKSPLPRPAAQEKRPRKEGASRKPGSRTGESPDNRWQAFIKDNNVWVRSAAGEEFALTSDGTADDAYGGEFCWSPDSTRLVAIRTAKGDDRKVYYVESSPKDQLQPKLHSYAYLKPGDRIPVEKPHLFDVAARKPIPVSEDLFPTPWSITDVRWMPDSSRFTFLYNQRGHQVLRVVAVDASTGAARAVVDERSKTFIDYAGKHFQHDLPKTHEMIWMSERDGWNHLYLYDAETGRVKNPITRGEWVVRGVDRVDEEARQIWFRAGGIRPGQDPYFVHYARVNFDGTGLVILTEGDGTHAVEWSPDRRFFIDTGSRVDVAPIRELRRGDDGKLVCTLERAEWGELLKAGWKAPEPFVAKGRDGSTDIYGVIFRPMGLDPQKKYPVIEDIYAGPQGSYVPKNFHSYYKTQSLAELGFIVVQIDGMGTSNRSKKFHDVCWRNLGDAGFPDRILWMQAAAKKYPYMDLSRVGIYGGSAGGQSAAGALLLHGDFYKVAVADCGCHDNRMDKIWWNELWMGWPVGPPYAEQSNVTLAPRLQGRLLLIVGEMDNNVDPSSTLQVASALVKANKDFDLLVIPGTGHGAAETPYGNRRRQDFFVRHLLGVEPRDRP
jgi:dipeptidyl aminopeptidase/acylaminoacyl peptidase